MYNDMLIGDGVLHAFNNLEENCRMDSSKEVVEGGFELAAGFAPEGKSTPEDVWFSNISGEDVSRATFLESDVDFGVYHGLPLYDYFEDGWSTISKAYDMRERAPERIKILGAVDPLADDAEEQMEQQWNEGNVDGFKFYPMYYQEDGARPLKLDDELLPLVEKAHSLGAENIAAHKTFPIGPVGAHHFGVEDIADIATQFPDIRFEIVHPDRMFLDQTKFILGNYDNVWANFETSIGYMYLQPRRFATILGELLLFGGADKLLFATGVPQIHPHQVIVDFWNYQFPDEIREEYGYPELTDEMKRKILGENLLELYDWDRSALEEAVESDYWHEQREEHGRPEEWTSLSDD
jgi:predicted TIM-barrel fold metal-dependent hydrolase